MVFTNGYLPALVAAYLRFIMLDTSNLPLSFFRIHQKVLQYAVSKKSTMTKILIHVNVIRSLRLSQSIRLCFLSKYESVSIHLDRGRPSYTSLFRIHNPFHPIIPRKARRLVHAHIHHVICLERFITNVLVRAANRWRWAQLKDIGWLSDFMLGMCSSSFSKSMQSSSLIPADPMSMSGMFVKEIREEWHGNRRILRLVVVAMLE